jgi:hypothetical protein
MHQHNSGQQSGIHKGGNGTGCLQQTAEPSLGATPKQTAQNRLFSLKHEFPNEWYTLLHPASTSAEYGQMPVEAVPDQQGRPLRPVALKGSSMTDIFLIALGGIPLAIAVVKGQLHNRGISPRQLREHLSEAKLPQ